VCGWTIFGFEENQDALHCLDGFNLTVTGNDLDDHLGHGVVIESVRTGDTCRFRRSG
jgi:hypothetical protein